MQIPVGVLFDKKNTRLLLTGSAVLCSIGCFLFARSHTLTQLIISRLILGTGSSFAFVGLSQLLRQHIPLRHFSFMIGLSETLGFIVTMLGMLTLGSLIGQWGWRVFFICAGDFGLLIALSAWILVPNNTPLAASLQQHSTLKNLKIIISNPMAWMNGLYVAFGFTVITVFAAMWAVPFLQIKLLCNLKEASQLDAMLFMGVAISCPLLGQLNSSLKKRKPLLIGSSLVTALLLLLILYVPTQSAMWCGVLLFLIGLSCGSYMIAYSISNELAPTNAKSTATGFTNTLATLTPLIQPIIGRVIDMLNASNPSAALAHYQYALTIIPLALVAAAWISVYLPEK
jgi:MFS family permease